MSHQIVTPLTPQEEVLFEEVSNDADYSDNFFKTLRRVNDLNALLDSNKNTLLHVASLNNSLFYVSLFLALGISTSAVNKDNKTAGMLSKTKEIKLVFKMHERNMKRKIKDLKLDYNDLQGQVSYINSHNQYNEAMIKFKEIEDKKMEMEKMFKESGFEEEIEKIRDNYANMMKYSDKMRKYFYTKKDINQEAKYIANTMKTNDDSTKVLVKRLLDVKDGFNSIDEEDESEKLIKKLEEEIAKMKEVSAKKLEDFVENKNTVDISKQFVLFISIINQDLIENHKRSISFLNSYKKLSKDYIIKVKGFKKAKLKLQLDKLSGNKKSQKLKKDEAKVNSAEREIMRMKREMERIVQMTFLKTHSNYDVRKAINDIQRKSESTIALEKFFRDDLENEELCDAFIIHGLVCDRDLGDYNDMNRYVINNHGVVKGLLKRDPIRDRYKLLKLLRKKDLKTPWVIDELEDLARINEFHHSNKLSAVDCCFCYKNAETQEITFVIQMTEYKTTLFHWLKGSDEFDIKVSDLLKMKTIRSKTEIRSIFRQLVKAICFCYDKEFQYVPINPYNIAVTQDGRVKLLNYSITHNRNSLVLCTDPAQPIRRYTCRGHGKDVIKTGFYAFGMMLYEALADPKDSHFNGLDSFPEYFAEDEQDLLTILLDPESKIKRVNKIKYHPFFTRREESNENALSVKEIQKNKMSSKVEIPILLNKKTTDFILPLLNAFNEINDIDSICCKFKGKYGIDVFGNLSPLVLHSFFEGCFQRGLFEGNGEGYYMPIDSRSAEKTFKVIGKILLKLLLDKRSEIKKYFTPFVFSFLSGEKVSTKEQWEYYCSRYDKKFVKRINKLADDDGVEDLGLIIKGEKVVDDDQIQDYLKSQYKKKLLGTKFRLTNLNALRSGFTFTLKSQLNNIDPEDLIDFFCLPDVDLV